MTERILLGTSGYAYDDWEGVLYPPQLPRNRRLERYAAVFNALEINATYYGTPRPEAARRAVSEAHGRLAFAIKAPGDMTHRGRTDAATARSFLDYLEPFRAAGVLAAVLLQFPNAFHRTKESRAQLERTVDALPALPLAVELRHASWDSEEGDAVLRDRGISRAAIDQPALRGLSRSARITSTGPLAYFRFHGRNAAAWYGTAGEDGDNRYRYRYRAEELKRWVPLVRESRSRASTTLVFFNNHPDGNAVLDAETFATMLGQPIDRKIDNDLFA